jgi:hypothetical protein
MSRFGTYAELMGTDMDADAERARDARRLRELDAADQYDPGIDAGLNLAVDKLLDAVQGEPIPDHPAPAGFPTGLRAGGSASANSLHDDGAAMDLQRPDRFEME